MERSKAQVLIFEDLKLRNMTRAPASKRDKNGKYIPNGGAAKSGLNKALLGNVLGRVLLLTTYKAQRAGKTVLLVNPARSSQECSVCGFTAAANRVRGQFHCLRCDSTKHADANASETLENRGLAIILNQPPETDGLTPPKTGFHL